MIQVEDGIPLATRDVRAQGGVNDTMLRSYVERCANLHEQRKAIADDISDVLKEAACNGFDKLALKEVVKAYLEDADKRAKRGERMDTLSVYMNALGLA